MKDNNDKKRILVCSGPGCLAQGSLEILAKFKELVAGAGAQVETEAVVKKTGCHGPCEHGPVVRVLPQDVSYYRVRAADAEEIFKETVLSGKLVQRLKPNALADIMRRQVKIALRNTGEIDPLEIDDYLERGGYEAARKALFSMQPDEIIREVEVSGLRGRGGAGFPTGRKWRTCASFDRFPRYVICNGDEGDPGAFMDRSIIEGDPHSIIEGMIIGAYAVGAREGYIYIRDEYDLAVQTMQEAIRQAGERGFLGQNIMGSGIDLCLKVVRGGGAFVCGESTALMASIEGRVGEPRAKYIRSVERGLWGMPTVLNNVETWANIPVIIAKGGDYFKQIGLETSTGTKVFSLVGKVKNTGLVEVPMGVTLRELVYAIGGGILGGKKFKAVQTGGPSGGCIPENMLDLPVDFDSLTAAGSMMGSGGMIVMDERTCMVDTARYYVNFLAEESCGKCVPCREGLGQMREILNDICRGEGRDGDIELLAELARTAREASLCGLGKSAANPVLSTICHFRDEYEEHIRGQRCPAGICRELTVFAIDGESCTGCGVCKKNCPANAIRGEPKSRHEIDAAVCVKCGNCLDVCRFDAVSVL